MTVTESLNALYIRGCTLCSTPDGELEIEGDDIVIDELLPLIRSQKSELLALLADPRKAANQAWKGAIEDIAARWKLAAAEHRARGSEPHWLDETLDQDLQAEVAESIRAGDLARAMTAIDRWRRAWLDILVKPTEGADPRVERGWVEIDSALLGERVVVTLRPGVVETARTARPDLVVYAPAEIERLHGTKDESLIRAAHAAKKLFGGVVKDPRIVDTVLAESAGRRPPPNPTVYAMFDAARARFGYSGVKERSMTAWLQSHAPEVSARWPEAPLDAGWFQWRGLVEPDQVDILDEAYEAVTDLSIRPPEGE